MYIVEYTEYYTRSKPTKDTCMCGLSSFMISILLTKATATQMKTPLIIIVCAGYILCNFCGDYLHNNDMIVIAVLSISKNRNPYPKLVAKPVF